MFPRAVPSILTLLLGSTFALAASTSFSALDRCDDLVRRDPASPAGWACYRATGQAAGAMDEAVRRIEARLAIDPRLHRGRLELAFLAIDRGEARAESLLRETAKGYERDGDLVGAALAREKLAMLFTNTERYAEAEAELDRADALADASGDDTARATLAVQRGWTALRQGRFVRAGLHMERGEALAVSSADRAALQLALGGRAAVAWSTGRLAEAVGIYKRQATILREAGNTDALAQTLGNLLGVSKSLIESGEMRKEELIPIARDTLAAGTAAGQPWGIVRGHLALAQALEGDEARDHARLAIERARATGNRGMIRGIEREAGYRLVHLDPSRPDEGMRAIRASLDGGRRFGNPDEEIRSRSYLASAIQEVGPLERTVEAYTDLFAAIERLRDLQRDDAVRAGAFSNHAVAYRRLAGHLLDAGAGDPEAVDRAFRTLERMRARVLLDRLDAGGAAPVPTGPLAEERNAVLEAIAAVQRSLLGDALDDAARGAALRELERLEREETRLRAEIAESDPGFGAVRAPDFPTAADVAEALDEDEALLAFSIAPGPAAGAWLLAIDRRGTRAFRLPPAGDLRRRVEFFRGLLERRDGAEADAALLLGEALLGEAVRALPEGTRRLILVPDGPLWRLPFDALRVGDGSRLVGERFATSLAASATVWRRLRIRPKGRPEAPLLAFADPSLPAAEVAPSAERAWASERGAALGPLPGARREVRTLARRLGGGSRILVGPEATEVALKAEAGGRYAVVHLAAHALVDEERPHRSAVVLAAGTEGEDGLLQPREIAALHLGGAVVILTACRSASGAVLDGEGPLSLAHAFFQGGARAVIGGLWPLRDDDVEALVSDFAAALAEGASVAEALATARSERIAAGDPVEAWAGLVLLGDGAAVPLPDADPRPVRWVPAAIVAGLLGVFLLFLRFRLLAP